MSLVELLHVGRSARTSSLGDYVIILQRMSHFTGLQKAAVQTFIKIGLAYLMQQIHVSLFLDPGIHYFLTISTYTIQVIPEAVLRIIRCDDLHTRSRLQAEIIGPTTGSNLLEQPKLPLPWTLGFVEPR